ARSAQQQPRRASNTATGRSRRSGQARSAQQQPRRASNTATKGGPDSPPLKPPPATAAQGFECCDAQGAPRSSTAAKGFECLDSTGPLLMDVCVASERENPPTLAERREPGACCG